MLRHSGHSAPIAEIGQRLANALEIGMGLRVGIHVLLQLVTNIVAGLPFKLVK